MFFGDGGGVGGKERLGDKTISKPMQVLWCGEGRALWRAFK